MIQYLQYLVFVGLVVELIGTSFYIKETIWGNTRPNRVTWLMWSIAPLIATFAAVSKGVGWAVLPVFMAGFSPFLVFVSSFINKNSYWRLKKFDYFCGFCSLLALILWGITKEPNVAIIFSIVSDGSATIPTLVKAWRMPETESASAYIVGLINALTTFAAIKIWDFASLGFPVYLVIACSLLLFSICRKKFLKS